MPSHERDIVFFRGAIASGRGCRSGYSGAIERILVRMHVLQIVGLYCLGGGAREV